MPLSILDLWVFTLGSNFLRMIMKNDGLIVYRPVGKLIYSKYTNNNTPKMI